MTARLAAVLAGVAVIGVGALIIGNSASGGHTLRASFDNVIQLTDGQQVRMAGRRVGELKKIDLVAGRPVVTLQVGDSVWPLPRGTRARIRWGSTTSYTLR